MSSIRIWRPIRERLGAMRIGSLLPDLNWTFLGVIVFSALYLAAYASQQMLPGEHPIPTWEHWHDQGQYLRSARAFADGNLADSEHWFPPGYSLLGAPFVHLTPVNPFVIPDFLCFVLYFLGFMRLTREWLPPAAALVCFGLGTLYPPFLLCQYIYPWNTIPVAALLVWFLALLNESPRDDRLRIDFAIGLLAGLVIAIRQIEMMAMVPAGAAYLCHRLAGRQFANIAWAALPFAIPPLLVAGVIFSIHGTLATPYIMAADKIGFSLAGFTERATSLFLDASMYNERGAAVRNFQPFVVAMLPACLAAGVLWRRQFGVPVAACLAALLLYLSYNDFSPIDIVRFYLVHYIQWTFPIILAAGISGLVLLFRERRYLFGALTLAGMTAMLLMGVQVVADRSHAVLKSSTGACDFAVMSTQPGDIDALDLVGASAPREDAILAKADGTDLVYRKDYDVIRIRRGLRLILKSGVRPRSLQVYLPPAQNPHCSAGLIEPLRSVSTLRMTGTEDPLFAPPSGVGLVSPERLSRQIGYVEAEGDGRYSVVADAGEEGYVVFGPNPYEELPDGGYAATFTLSAMGTAEDGRGIVFDVAAELGGKPGTALATTVHSGQRVTPLHASLRFVVEPGTRQLQYRIFKPHGYSVRFSGLEISRLSDAETKALVFEREHEMHVLLAEKMTRNIGHIETEKDGKALVVAAANEAGYLGFGPREDLRAGHYTATFVLTVGGVAAAGANMLFDVIGEENGKAEPVILASDTRPGSEAQQRVTVQFDVAGGVTKLQYRVLKPRGYKVRFVSVEVAREGD